MIPITKITVRSFSLDYLDVFWEIPRMPAPVSGMPHEVFDYDFYVLRSEAALGPYEVRGGPYRDSYDFRDTVVNLLHKWRQIYYKIRVVHRPSGETQEFGPASSLQPEHDLIASEIVRQEDMLFREFVGRRCILYPCRTFGPGCSCFDAVTNRRTRSQCKQCFNTGWLGGFLSPVEVFVQIDPFPKEPKRNALQEIQPSDTVGRMICFPPVSPNDILIEPENRRWRVLKVSSTQRLRSIVRQELQIHEIPKGDVEYALPVNVNIKSFSPSAPRNFTNPQNLQKEDYSDIFAVYGHPRGVLR